MPAQEPSAETFRFAPPYELPRWPFVDPPERARGERRRHPVVIVGAGLAGLTLACDLATRGVRAIVLDEDDTIGVRGASSRGICYAQKSLEIFARLGIYERIAERGITWSFGRTFSTEREVYQFNLRPDSHSVQPPFINLQQFYIEWFLVDRILALGLTELRWQHRVSGVEPLEDGVRVAVDTPAGPYALEADWLIDATGANSPIRTQLGLEAHASRGTDRWCISDVRFAKPLPVERWTWVDAPFNEGRAVWQHLMGDGVWRMDYQMPEHSDPDAISRPEVAGARLRAQLGPDVDFEFVWIGPYGYREHLLDRFVEGRVIFIGDSAHVVSPFGARGGNTGIQDAANLAWKLALVLDGRADGSLLASFDAERHAAAAENLRVTSRTARFLAPRSPAEQVMRRAVIDLARHHAFARALVNTGRMSVPNAYPPSPWAAEGARSVQNLAMRTADGRASTLSERLAAGGGFVGLWFAPASQDWRHLNEQLATHAGLPELDLLAVDATDESIDAARRLSVDAPWREHLDRPPPGSFVLIRPDAYRGSTIEAATPQAILQALRRAIGGAAGAALPVTTPDRAHA